MHHSKLSSETAATATDCTVIMYAAVDTISSVDILQQQLVQTFNEYPCFQLDSYELYQEMYPCMCTKRKSTERCAGVRLPYVVDQAKLFLGEGNLAMQGLAALGITHIVRISTPSNSLSSDVLDAHSTMKILHVPLQEEQEDDIALYFTSVLAFISGDTIESALWNKSMPHHTIPNPATPTRATSSFPYDAQSTKRALRTMLHAMPPYILNAVCVVRLGAT